MDRVHHIMYSGSLNNVESAHRLAMQTRRTHCCQDKNRPPDMTPTMVSFQSWPLIEIIGKVLKKDAEFKKGCTVSVLLLRELLFWAGVQVLMFSWKAGWNYSDDLQILHPVHQRSSDLAMAKVQKKVQTNDGKAQKTLKLQNK
ncbi:hypothetical protein K435DRAFT_790951 [Dendrothele bispora CBS 962.96]|uniref:Uncharacterized protein n=1 Tax=Dendrothele bispora (strain CBS 962.96) TaxID=1314807 RepID=A0A4S8MPS0_DENBC|nr:hypothetical protein K435DRAFT_790951 [Dendrothele bispora CBS 962.96]